MIVSHPRSGSNFLRDAINSHPDAFEFGEAFHVNPAVSIYPAQLLGMDQLPVSKVDHLMRKLAYKRKVRATGFTLFSDYKGHLLGYQAAADLVTRPDLHVIFLIRRNLLKAFVSFKRAMLTGLWHVDACGRLVEWEHTVPNPNAKRQEIGPIDRDEAKAWIDETLEFLGQLEKIMSDAGKPCLKLYYEDLCLEDSARSLDEINRVFRFLELRQLLRYDPKFGRTADSDFYRLIPNLFELVSTLGYDLD